MPDIASIFSLTVNPLELVLRGTAMYWFLFLLLRFVLRRDVGSIGIADVLLLVLLADAAQNAMAGGYQSVTDGVILVGTIAGWNWILDMAAFRFPPLRKVLEAKPLQLVVDGRVLRRNLRKEYITDDELMAKLRENGIETVADVKVATMESDGEITVIKRDGGGDSGKSKPKAENQGAG
ncbi:MAG: YetF domain-containing protein [Ramlibacter sp.]